MSFSTGQSLSKQLQELSDPRPTEFHPDQEDWDECTSARVSQTRTYDDKGKVRQFSGSTARESSSKPRKQRVVQLDCDPRYAGRPVSLRELYSCEDEGWLVYQKWSRLGYTVFVVLVQRRLRWRLTCQMMRR